MGCGETCQIQPQEHMRKAQTPTWSSPGIVSQSQAAEEPSKGRQAHLSSSLGREEGERLLSAFSAPASAGSWETTMPVHTQGSWQQPSTINANSSRGPREAPLESVTSRWKKPMNNKVTFNSKQDELNLRCQCKTEAGETMKPNHHSGYMEGGGGWFWPLEGLEGWHRVRLPQSPTPLRRQAYLRPQDTRVKAAHWKGRRAV